VNDRQPIAVSLSTSSVYPESTATAFEMARRIGYDAVEIMVGIDETSTDPDAVEKLTEEHGIRVGSVHAPCLLLTQRTWGLDPWGKLDRSAQMALQLGASVVVVHPPFRWQRDYARGFVEGVAELEEKYELEFAVENMYPWRTGKREFQAYAPGWDPRPYDYAHVTLDLSHTATAKADALRMAEDLGSRLRHIHLADGSGSGRDEHMVPGRGSQPCAELLERLATDGFDGQVVVEISTRKAADAEERELDLLRSLTFARLHTSPLPS